MKKTNILITNAEIAKEIENYFEKHEIKCLIMPNCKGISSHSSWTEYLGFSEDQFCTILFKATESENETIERFILKNFNEKNNGIMFSLKGENEMEDDVLYIAIVNAGFGEKVSDTIREKAHVGSTIVEARGIGKKENELFGMQIDSGKELILSVMPSDLVTGVKQKIKHAFKNTNTDVVAFVLPVSHFSKMHT